MSLTFFKKKTTFILGVMLILLVGCKANISEEISIQQSENEQQKQIEQPEQSITELPKESQQIEEMAVVKSQFQWPKDFIPGLPDLNGEIRSLYFDIPRPEDEVQEPQFARMEFVNMEEETADKFIEGLKEGGYIENSIYEKTTEHTKYYVMNLPTVEGNRIYFKWTPSNKIAIVSLLKPGWLALEAYSFIYGDDTGTEDLSPWPTDFIPNYPEPVGKIVDVDYFESDTQGIECTGYIIFLYYGDRQSVVDCIQEMKKRYIYDTDEISSENELMYTGLSDFYGDHKFDSANIYYQNPMGTTIQGGFVLGDRYKTISVYMSKAK